MIKTDESKNSVSVLKEVQGIYRTFGYKRFKMNKFEEYDTYVRVKDFLISDKVITFTGTNGKLLAMKPDVTVSIIKNSDDAEENQGVKKFYYNENVYRVSGKTHDFREIMQTGLECIGDIDEYNLCEVVMLAAKSLSTISESFVLDISHMGYVSGLIDACGASETDAAKILKAVSEKNTAELLSVCEKANVSSDLTEKLMSLVSLYGPAKEVIKSLGKMCVNDEMKKAEKTLSSIVSALSENGFSHNINIDFSVVNDMNYYNGLVFRGYIEGVPEGVLSGGQYDKLMKKMGKSAKAVGFAIYLDLLERVTQKKERYDADVLLVYEDGVPPSAVLKKAKEITLSGKTVLVEKCESDKLICGETIFLTKEDA
ncbi:MAG: ATP phosphoribosyltransferase regulatory subunit [Clostridia bacterium]|nr:ATP phosphoribosyltransferase regulatory subunit [Clostridia bacterium]